MEVNYINSFQSRNYLDSAIKNGLKVIPFTEVFDDVSSKFIKIKLKEINNSGAYPVIDQSEEFISGYSNILPKPKDKMNVIIFGDHTKILKYVDFPFIKGADGVKVLSLRNENYNIKYFYYFLKTLNLPDLGYSRYYKILKETYIPVPNIQSQNKFAKIFECIENLIQNRQDQIQTLDDLLKSVFNESLNESNNIVKIKDYVKVNPAKSEVKELDPDTIISFVPMQDVSENGELNLSKTKTIEEAYKGFTYFKNDDVVVAKITPCFENGKGTLMKNLVNGIGFGTTEFHVLRCKNKNILNPVWLNYLTRTRYFRKLGEIRMSGSAGQKRVGKDFVENFEFNLPPIEKQNHFAAFVEKIEKQKQILNDSLGELNDLFDCLMQDAFDGSMIN